MTIQRFNSIAEQFSVKKIFVFFTILTSLLLLFQAHGNTLRFDAIELTRLEREQMQYLGFSEAEMRQFLVTRDIYRGYIDVDKLSPHEVLGILSKDPNQQKKYARAAAQLRLALINDTKQFEALYRAEVARLSAVNGQTQR